MPQGRVCVRAGACVAFQYSIGDAELSWSDRIRYAHCLFQYSIGDARSNIDGHVGGADDHLSILYWRCKNLNICGRSHWKVNHSFNTLLEMHPAKAGLSFTVPKAFQYSVGDAEGSCVWFLWVFKFLCRRVWVSCGGLLTVVVLVLSLCWCAEKRGVGVCVFFSSASACAGRLHGVL